MDERDIEDELQDLADIIADCEKDLRTEIDPEQRKILGRAIIGAKLGRIDAKLRLLALDPMAGVGP